MIVEMEVGMTCIVFQRTDKKRFPKTTWACKVLFTPIVKKIITFTVVWHGVDLSTG